MKMTRIIVTGSRNFTDSHSIYGALKDAVWMLGVPAPEITIVHGGARGADALAGMIGHHMMMRVEVHSADWQTHHNAAGPIRNREMVALGADLCKIRAGHGTVCTQLPAPASRPCGGMVVA